MRITRGEVGLLLAAIETRVRALARLMDDPVLGTCVDEADKKKFCAAIEGYAGLRRKIALSDKAMLAREGR